MCIVSNIVDDFTKRWPWDNTNPYPSPYIPHTDPIPITEFYPTGPSREEFDKLKKDFEEFKELVKAAKRYDERTGQPDCEMESKVQALKKIADFLGVDIKDLNLKG